MPTLVWRLAVIVAFVTVAVGAYLVFTAPVSDTVISVPPPTLTTPTVALAVQPAATDTAVPPRATAEPPIQTPAPTPTLAPLLREDEIVSRYGGQSFASLDDMPADMRRFYEQTISDISAFFNVRAEDLSGLVYQAGNGAVRLPLTTAGDATTALVPVALWNGPGTAPSAEYLTDMRVAERAGGIGFNWADRNQWKAWMAGQLTVDTPPPILADPHRFTNGVAALARYLAVKGVTTSVEDPTLASDRLTGVLAGLYSSYPAVERGSEWTAALQREMDSRLGMALSVEKAAFMVGQSGIDAHGITPTQGAAVLYLQSLQGYIEAGATATRAGTLLPWPFVKDSTDLAVQEAAVRTLGHTLTGSEIASWRDTTQDNVAEIETALAESSEGTFYARSRPTVDEALQRSARGLPLMNYEVAVLVQAALSGESNSRGGTFGGSSRTSTRTTARLGSELQYYLHRLPEYRDLHGDLFFAAAPFDPMPRMGQPYGVPVDYQSGGVHTGVDIRGDSVRGQQPDIHAVGDAVVTYVGPLYCLSDTTCRGPNAIVLDHGNNVYTVYSHNSEAYVQAGDRVVTGQPIARQGQEGYARGPHLHLELHVGAPFSGVWTNPWTAGQFIDPWPWLPKTDTGTPS